MNPRQTSCTRSHLVTRTCTDQGRGVCNSAHGLCLIIAVGPTWAELHTPLPWLRHWPGPRGAPLTLAAYTKQRFTSAAWMRVFYGLCSSMMAKLMND